MGFLTKTEASMPGQADDFWYQPAGLVTDSGALVSPEGSLRQADVYKCVNILSQTLASTPLILYRELERGKERAKQHPLYPLLKKRPNFHQTAYEFKQMMMTHLALRGVSYNEIVPGPRGAVDQLLPLHPDRVKPERLSNGDIQYRVQDQHHGERILKSFEMFRVLGLTLDGINPIGPIEYHRQTVGNALTAQRHGNRILANDGTPPIVIYHPGHFKDDKEFKRFRRRWRQNQTGRSKGSAAVLEDGMKIEKIGMTNADIQYIESRKFDRSDIAGIFRIPLVLMQDGEKTQTFASAEQFFLSFIKFTMIPWYCNIEQAADRDLVAELDEDIEFFYEFLSDTWLRGDSKARAFMYKEALTDGWLTRNEVRQMENRNPLTGLDEPLQMLNMTGASDDIIDDDEDKDETLKEESARVARTEAVAITEARDRYDSNEEFNKWAVEYYGKFRKMIRSSLGLDIPTASAYCEQSFLQIKDVTNINSLVNTTWEAEQAERLYQLARQS